MLSTGGAIDRQAGVIVTRDKDFGTPRGRDLLPAC
jgi:hypothetical protein